MVVNSVNIFSTCPTKVAEVDELDSETMKVYRRKVVSITSSSSSPFISYCNDCCGTFGTETVKGRCPFCGSYEITERSSQASRYVFKGISDMLKGMTPTTEHDDCPFGGFLAQAA